MGRRFCRLVVVATLLVTAFGVPAGQTAAQDAVPAGSMHAEVAAHANAKKAKKPKKAKNAVPGKYRGRIFDSEGKRHETFRFRVTRDGRRLTKFYVALAVICNTLPPTVQAYPVGFPATKINRKHRFKRVWRPEKDSRIVLAGRFKGRRLVSGRINYQVGICVRTGWLKARRVG